MRIFVIVMILIIKLYSYKVPTTLLFSIAKAENKNIFYPYIISINNKLDIKRLKNIGIHLKNNRIINCYDLKTCIKATKLLVRAGITNIDLGTFQINYKYHKLPLKNYFEIIKSVKFVDKYIYSIAKKFQKWNWKILAMYHSSTLKENSKYIRLVNYYYSKIYYKKDKYLLKEYRRFLKIISNN